MNEFFLSISNKFLPKKDYCSKVYCTTCGGQAFAIKSNMSEKLNEHIRWMLSDMTFDGFIRLGDWKYFLHEQYNKEVGLIFYREGDRLDPMSIFELDRFLFHARRFIRFSDGYQEKLKLGIKVINETPNESLIETIIIILGDTILDHDDLLALVLRESKRNKVIHGVLYNFVREQLPEVRGYVGNGGLLNSR